MEPRFAVGPECFSGTLFQAHCIGRLAHGHSDKVAELYELRNLRILCFQLVEGLVNSNELCARSLYDN